MSKAATTETLYSADYATIYAAGQRASRAGDFAALAVAQDALAHHHWRRHDLRAARGILNAAIDSTPVEYIRERLMLLNTLLLIELASRRYARALEVAPRAIADAELLDDSYLRGQAHGFMAVALAKTGEADRAFDHYTAAHHFFEGNLKHQAVTDNNIANLLIESGRHEDSHFYLDRAELGFRELARPSELGQVWETRARAFIAANDLGSAMSAIEESLELIPEEHKAIRAESYRTKGRIHELRGDKPEAEWCYLEAMRLVSVGEDDPVAVGFHDPLTVRVDDAAQDHAEEFSHGRRV